MEPNIEPNIEQNIEPEIELNIEPNIEYVIASSGPPAARSCQKKFHGKERGQFQGFFKEGCLQKVSRVFQGSLKGVSRKF